MVVVDTNVIAYLYIDAPQTPAASQLLIQDPVWTAPPLWRFELRNLLATLTRVGKLRLDEAVEIVDAADDEVRTPWAAQPANEVLHLAQRSRCTAYDCEFVALAMALDVPFVTADRKLVKAFPAVAKLLGEPLQDRSR